MRMYLLALNPTDSVTEGFLPAARSLGLRVTVLTDQPEAHRTRHPDLEVLPCDVRDFREVISVVSAHERPDAIFTNSDHLQTQTALAADYFGLPAKDWRTALRTKDKALLRRHLRTTGADHVRCLEIPATTAPADALRTAAALPYPCVVKPREGVASEDVVRVESPAELLARCEEIRARRPGAALVVEEYLEGELYTLETLGDGNVRHVLGGFRTALSPAPYFIEERLTYVPAHPPAVVDQILAQLDALGVGFGACHTEFVVDGSGRARIIEVNYRAIGDQCDLLLADLLGIPLFAHVLLTHLGEPLPADLGARTDGAARLDYPYARRAGTLTAAPQRTDLDADGVRLTYRPLRALGERHEVHHTNRDLLGVVRATGRDQGAVDRAVEDFLAHHHWEITP
ncbi:acetyl-CoA carboxylase biotin carboxylase subunit family protein [Streptomyces sp. NPDC127068]|uniref:ATP-grasp domain-containing protein n=1 Tax=Streptomyces sp. NPDC127068 TaxID=3347127 RepID=UPI00365828FB